MVDLFVNRLNDCTPSWPATLKTRAWTYKFHTIVLGTTTLAFANVGVVCAIILAAAQFCKFYESHNNLYPYVGRTKTRHERQICVQKKTVLIFDYFLFINDVTFP